MMSAVVDFLIGILGQVMRVCYNLIGNYGLSIMAFTLITKLILFPVNLLTQKNSIKMVKMQPELDALKIKYIDDKDKFADEQLALYKRYKYNPFLGMVPLLIQIPIVLGVVGVVYRPLSYMMNISQDVIAQLNDWLTGTLGVTDAENLYQLEIFYRIQSGAQPPSDISQSIINVIRSFDMHFLGINLAETPSFHGDPMILLVPLLAGLSALTLCFAQNKVNVLQMNAGKMNKILTTLFMVSFSTYFAMLVPTGVGLYWICGNLFAIPFMFLVNFVIPPKKYIDYEYLRKMKEQKQIKEKLHAAHMKRERADYKRFSAVENMKLMIYSEQNGFYKYFAGMIDYICEHSDLDIHYVTSDPNDNIFQDTRKNIHAYYIGSDNRLIPLFMKLDCDMCIMTTPDLEKYHIKRSRVRKDTEYVYVSHGMGSKILTVRKGALDWFDTVFSTGPTATDEIREAEQLYHTRSKTLIAAGYPLLDDMLEQYQPVVNPVPKILIAPSWQPDNILDNGIDEILDTLSDSEYEVILRPHPQAVRMYPEKFDIMKEKYKGKNITVQTDFSASDTVFNADILMTDWSNIGLEFAFTTLKPVLYINTPMKIMNPDYDKFKTENMDITLRNVIGKSLETNELNRVLEVVNEFLNSSGAYRSAIEKARGEYIYNVGKSKQLYGRYVIKRLGG